MKKIITILFATMMTTSAFANGMIGIKYGTGELDGTQKAYTDTRSGSGSDIAAVSASEDHEYGAVFLELNIPDVDGLSAGIEIIPFTATLTVDSSTTDSHLELSDYTTLYGLYSYDVGEVSVYGKLGYSRGDISNVTANFATTAVTAHSKSLEGVMYGIGFQREVSEFVARIEATYTDFDNVSVTTSHSPSDSVKKSW